MSRRVLVLLVAMVVLAPVVRAEKPRSQADKKPAEIVVRVASATNDNPQAAGRAAAEALKRAMGNTPPKVVLLSECFEDKANKEKVLAGVTSIFPRDVVLGAATYGSFTHAGCTDADSVCLAGMGGDGVKVSTALVTNMGASHLTYDANKEIVGQRLRTAGARLANSLRRTPQDRLMVLLADAHSPKNQALMEGVQQILGPKFPITGGCANKNAGQTFVYFGGRVYEDAAVGLMFSGDFRVGLSGRQAKENEAVIQTAGQGAQEAASRVKGKPVAALAFNCAGRRSKLKNIAEELVSIQKAIGKELPLFGCYCAGEMGPVDQADKPAGVLCGGSGWHIMFTVISQQHAMPSLSEAMAAAIAAHQANQFDRAEQIYRAILKVYPEHAEAQSLLGATLYQQGRVAEAVPWVESAVRLDPQQAACWSNLGMVYAAAGQAGPAAAALERAVGMSPDRAELHFNLGITLADVGRLEEATAALERAIAIAPHLAVAHRRLGSLREQQLRWAEAAQCYRRSLDLEPKHVDTLRNLGTTLHSLGRLDEAEQVLQQALAIEPGRAEIVARLGILQQAEGRIDEALASYRTALAIEPSTPWIHSGCLMCLQYRPGITPGELAAEHAEWNRRHAAPLRSQWRDHAVDRDPQRPLRLGFVSTDFGFHTVGVLLIRALEGLGEQPCEIFCYSDKAAPDPFTPRFVQAAHAWRPIAGLSDEAVAEQIRADRIDVLFELAGHTPRNRLLVLARKPAPIQVTWLGYVGTTGLEAIDYLVADPRQIPPGDERHYCERILRMPDDYATFEPFPLAPAVGPLPAERTGRVTFGSLNNPSKLNPELIALWSRILLRLPGSRLLLRYRGLDGRVRQRLAERFAAHGVGPERLELRGGGSNVEMYAQYNEIDVGLDPLPYSGGLTTIEALWMGVPVITLPGPTFASRHALAHLAAVGLTETVARDAAHYVELAVELAEDRRRLAELRAGLRERVARSPLCDGRQAAAHLMQLLRQAWIDWLAGGHFER